jgi:hypothetical protein
MLALLPGCATFKYTSSRPKLEVAECIEAGWKSVPAWGGNLPVSLTVFVDYYFVSAGFSPSMGVPPITNTKHPFEYLWAEVRDSVSGSTTEYHRAFQALQEKLDRVVVECQGQPQ